MTIRRRVPVYLVFSLILLLAVVGSTSRTLILDNFVSLEEREVRLNLERAQNALIEEFDQVSHPVRDYANYDPIYAYMRSRDPKVPESEFGNLDTYRLNFAAIFDLDGNMIYMKAAQPAGGGVAEIPPGLPAFFNNSSPLLRGPEAQTPREGILVLPDGPLMVAVSPILNGDHKGPARGTLVMGRRLDATELGLIAQRTRLKLSVEPVAAGSLPKDFAAARAVLSKTQPTFVRPLNASTVAGYAWISDLLARPALILKTEEPRQIYAQGRAVLLYLLMWLGAAAFVFGLAMYSLTNRAVLSRLARLSRSVARIGERGKVSERVEIDGNDELTVLGKTINKTLGALEQAEESLRKTNVELEDRVKQRTAELAASRDAAQAASRVKSQFMANMSHELRTPMNGIMGMIELALDTEVTGEQRDYLETAKFSAGALLTIISDILDFSKMEATQLELRLVQFSTAECLGTAVRTLAEAAQDKGLGLVSEVDPDVPPIVVGDPGRLGQILLNLIGNAIKFTERGQVSVRVRATPADDDKVELEFAVSDTGIGVPQEMQAAIFESFTQVDMSSTRKYGGLGLGLATCSQLVKAMDGRMWVKSELGAGSTFFFTACLERSHAGELAPA